MNYRAVLKVVYVIILESGYFLKKECLRTTVIKRESLFPFNILPKDYFTKRVQLITSPVGFYCALNVSIFRLVLQSRNGTIDCDLTEKIA